MLTRKSVILDRVSEKVSLTKKREVKKRCNSPEKPSSERGAQACTLLTSPPSAGVHMCGTMEEPKEARVVGQNGHGERGEDDIPEAAEA